MDLSLPRRGSQLRRGRGRRARGLLLTNFRDLAAQADELTRLHHGPRLLVLPNAWDAASARAVEAAGFPVVATSSAAVAGCLGYPDTDSMPPDDAFTAVTRIATAVDVPVTADVEAGYGLPEDELVERLLAAGAVGCNLEDTDHHGGGGLRAAAEQAERLARVREAARRRGIDLAVNARVDVFRTAAENHAHLLDEGVARARAYLAAGATCVYPIRLADSGLIATFVEAVTPAPVNIMVASETPPLATLRELGVARVSFAGGLFRLAHAAVTAELQRISGQVRGTE